MEWLSTAISRFFVVVFFGCCGLFLLEGKCANKILPHHMQQANARNCCRATVVCLDVKGLWIPGQSFILSGFTLSLPCSAPCRSGQTTIDTGCDPAFLRNCIVHPADCKLFNKYNPIKFAIIRPFTLNYNRNLWNCLGGSRRDNLINSFFRCLRALTLICMQLFNVQVNNLN